MKQLEIERKFLITKLPPEFLTEAGAEQIRQGYLLLEADTELRIRERAGRCTITLKQGHGLTRMEQEKEIEEALFAMLWPLTAGRRIEKKRYTISWNDLWLEIDLFAGMLAPLILLEVEFTSINASRAFIPPAFVAQEVTGDRSYSNAMLATACSPLVLLGNENNPLHQHKRRDPMATPIDKVSGIGPATAAVLAGHQISTAEQLAKKQVGDVAAINGFSSIRAEQVIEAAKRLIGVPEIPATTEPAPKKKKKDKAKKESAKKTKEGGKGKKEADPKKKKKKKSKEKKDVSSKKKSPGKNPSKKS